MGDLGSFRQRLKRALEEGVLLFAKHVLVAALWAGSGALFWREVGVTRTQAINGQSAYQFLVANQKEIGSLIESRKQIDEALAKADKSEKKK